MKIEEIKKVVQTINSSNIYELLKENNLNVVYNDADPIIVNILKRVLSENREWIKTLIIDREEFFRIKEKKS